MDTKFLDYFKHVHDVLAHSRPPCVTLTKGTPIKMKHKSHTVKQPLIFKGGVMKYDNCRPFVSILPIPVHQLTHLLHVTFIQAKLYFY